MALTRKDSCEHFMNGSNFVKCLMRYNLTHGSKNMEIEVPVLASDLPGNSNPSDSAIMTIADSRALTYYTVWCTAVDSSPTESSHTGLSGTLA